MALRQRKQDHLPMDRFWEWLSDRRHWCWHRQWRTGLHWKVQYHIEYTADFVYLWIDLGWLTYVQKPTMLKDLR